MTRQAKQLWALGIAALCIDLLLLRLGLPTKILDARLYAPPEEIYRTLENQGIEGRALYQWIARLDLVFIAFYSAFFVQLLRFITRDRVRLTWISFAPIAALALFDFGETAGVLAILDQYPIVQPTLTKLVSVCTPLKWTALALTWLRLGWAFHERKRFT